MINASKALTAKHRTCNAESSVQFGGAEVPPTTKVVCMVEFQNDAAAGFDGRGKPMKDSPELSQAKSLWSKVNRK